MFGRRRYSADNGLVDINLCVCTGVLHATVVVRLEENVGRLTLASLQRCFLAKADLLRPGVCLC